MIYPLTKLESWSIYFWSVVNTVATISICSSLFPKAFAGANNPSSLGFLIGFAICTGWLVFYYALYQMTKYREDLDIAPGGVKFYSYKLILMPEDQSKDVTGERNQPRTPDQYPDYKEFCEFVNRELGDVPVLDNGRFIMTKVHGYWKTWRYCRDL